MPKWKSPIFSDIRNAIGDNVVFSSWKGRPFFRSFVIPANPNTNKQKAERANNTDLVKRYQSISADADVKAAWNVQALPYLISGYNLFVGWGRQSEISVSPTSGTAPLDVTITYKCSIPLARAGLYQLKDSTWSIVKDAGELLAEGTVNLEDLTAGTYYWFIADTLVLKPSESKPKAYQAVTKWKPNPTTGLDVECKCVVS